MLIALTALMALPSVARVASTIARIDLVQGLGPALQLAEGFTVELPDETHDILGQRSNPT